MAGGKASDQQCLTINSNGRNHQGSRCALAWRAVQYIVRHHVATSRLRYGAVSVFGVTVPLWWSPAIGVLILAVHRVMGSPERVSRAQAYVMTLVPSFIVGLVSGAVVVAIVRTAPLKAWSVFFISAAAGIVAGILVMGDLDDVAEALWSPGTWALALGSAMIPVVAQTARKRGV